MRVYVIDASIILKWVLPQDISPLQEQALSIRDSMLAGNTSLIVPSLWRYEVANTLGRLFPDNAAELLNHCCDVGIKEIAESSLRDKKALEIMSHWQVSFYDASYHALAIVNGLDFITADEKYAKKVKTLGSVQALKEWR